MATTAASLIRTAMQDLGVLGAGEAADGSHMQDGLRRLNLMIGGWSLDPLTSIRTTRSIFPITPGKYLYSIGPGLDFDVARPAGQQSVVGAGLILNAGQPNEVEIPRGLMTYDQWIGVRVKNLTNGLFTHVIYVPGSLARDPVTAPVPPYGIDTGIVMLWPIPTEAHPLVLYIERMVPMFESLTTSYPIPDGVAAAIQHNLTLAMAPMFQVEPSAFVIREAARTLASMKRNNYAFTDVALDPMFTFGSGAGYDIYSGSTRNG